MALMLIMGIVGLLGLAQTADDGSVPYPCEESSWLELAEESLWLKLEDPSEPGIQGLDWQCFKACFKDCYTQCYSNSVHMCVRFPGLLLIGARPVKQRVRLTARPFAVGCVGSKQTTRGWGASSRR